MGGVFDAGVIKDFEGGRGCPGFTSHAPTLMHRQRGCRSGFSRNRYRPSGVLSISSGQGQPLEITAASARIEPSLDRLGLLLNSQIGRRLQPDIIERIFTYWRKLLEIELPPGTPMRGHAEFIMGGALAMWAWRAR